MSGASEAGRGRGQQDRHQRHSPSSQSGLAHLPHSEWLNQRSAALHIPSTPAEQQHIHVIHVRRYTRRGGRRQHTITSSGPSGRQAKRSAKSRKSSPSGTREKTRLAKEACLWDVCHVLYLLRIQKGGVPLSAGVPLTPCRFLSKFKNLLRRAARAPASLSLRTLTRTVMTPDSARPGSRCDSVPTPPRLHVV